MRISVAMCTYEGASYVGEQLESIAAQTVSPEEIVVCDDGSRDATVDLVHRFAPSSPCPVRIVVNPVRLGSTKNFEKAIGLCTGDVVALADQDDVWQPDKLARLRDAFESRRAPGMVFSDAAVVDQALRPLPYTLWESVGFTRRERRRVAAGRTFDVLLRHYVVTGATMAFRRELAPLVLPIPATWVHDAWIAIVLAAVTTVEAVPAPLVRYRQHSGQQIGGRRLGLWDQYLVARRLTASDYMRIADNFDGARDRLGTAPRPLRERDALDRLRAKVAHLRAKARMRARPTWRPRRVLSELARGHYFRYSPSWKSVAADLFL